MSFATAETFGNVKRKDRHMNIRIDTHSHTLASGHAYNTLREMAAMAAEKGLEGLAVTEPPRKCRDPANCIIFRICGWFPVLFTISICCWEQS